MSFNVVSRIIVICNDSIGFLTMFRFTIEINNNGNWNQLTLVIRVLVNYLHKDTAVLVCNETVKSPIQYYILF